MAQFTYGFGYQPESYTCEYVFDTREAALAHAQQALNDDTLPEEVGQSRDVTVTEIALVDPAEILIEHAIGVEDLIEMANEAIGDDGNEKVGWYEEDYFTPNADARAWLQAELHALYRKWAGDFRIAPKLYHCFNAHVHELRRKRPTVASHEAS